MRIALVFDTPYADWTPAQHAAQMAHELAHHDEDEAEMEYQVAEALIANGHQLLLLGVHDDLRDMRARLAEWQPDLVFNATEAYLHNAELDYLIPAMLEAEGHRYTGAPPLSLLVTRNKAMSKKILAYHGINVPGFRAYRLGETPAAEVPLGFPLIVKPMQSDGSEGIAQASIVHDRDALVQRVGFIHERFAKAAIAEEYVEGRELYVTMVGNGDAVEVLPVVELVFDAGASRPEDRISTQRAKWDAGYRKRHGIKTVFARRLSKRATEQLHAACLTSFRALWLRDYARIDFRLADDDRLWFIEANANPYLSFGHNSAEAAHKAGMHYEAFIQRIVDAAMARHA